MFTFCLCEHILSHAINFAFITELYTHLNKKYIEMKCIYS